MGGAVAVVPLEARGALPLVDLHGEPMFVHPVRALLRSGVVARVVVTCEGAAQLTAVTRLAERRRLRVETMLAGDLWAGWSATGREHTSPVVVADPLCPLLPADFVGAVVAAAGDGAAAAYRPVTDTVKTVVDQRITGTLDRDKLAVVTSPVVVPAPLVAAGPPVTDAALLAAWLRARGDLRLLRAPSMARRVGDESALRVLECLDELGRRVHEA